MEQIINFITKDGSRFFYMPVDTSTALKFQRYLELCGSCEWARVERTALHLELLCLLHNHPTLFVEVPTGVNVVGLPTIQVIDHRK